MKQNLKALLRQRSPKVYRALSLARSYAVVGMRRRATVFTAIHRQNRWGAPTSKSGTGSELDQTAAVRRALPELISDIRCKSLLDIPCGDLNWITEIDLGTQTYIGADIVPGLTAANESAFGSEHRRFMTLDLVRDELPRVDLVFCRDCLVHFSYADILAALGNIHSSASTYLLTTTFVDRAKNHDIPTGAWRPLNLEQPPFNFPPAMRYIDENCTEGDGLFRDKQLGLWRISDLSVP